MYFVDTMGVAQARERRRDGDCKGNYVRLIDFTVGLKP
jgi:hypothetical protein